MRPTASRTGRRVRTMLALGALSVAVACGGAQISRPAASLRVVVVPENAAVYVNERFVGSARVIARRPESLSPGNHRVTVTASGFFPHDVAVELPEGLTTLQIRLRPIPP